MKEVITRGRFIITCYSCRTQFKYDEEDTFQQHETDYTGSTDIYKAVVCAVCPAVLSHHRAEHVT